MPDAHEDESDSKDDDEGDGEWEDGVSPIDASAFGLRGGGDGILAGDGAHLLDEIGLGQVAAESRSTAVDEPEHLGGARPLWLPASGAQERHDASAFFKPGAFARS